MAANYGVGFGNVASQLRLPDGTQQALQRLGSNYRIPGQEEDEDPLEAALRAAQEYGNAYMPKEMIEQKTQPHRSPTQLDEVEINPSDEVAAELGWRPRGGLPENPYTLTPDEEREVEQQKQAERGEPQPALGPAAPRQGLQLPPNTQQALERTGSSYKLPEAPPQVGDQPFNARAPQKQLRREFAGMQNEQLDAITAEGDRAAQTAEEQTRLLGQREQALGANRAETQKLVADGRAQKNAFEAEALARLDTLSQRMANPPKDTMGMVFGIVSALMAAKGNTAAAAGFQMLNKAINKSAQRYQAQMETDHMMAGEMLKLARYKNDDVNNEIDQQKMLSGLLVGEYDSALKRLEASNQPEEFRSRAANLRRDLRMKYVQQQIGLNEQRAAMEQKQAAAAAEDALYRMDVNDLAGAIERGDVGKQGQEVLQKRRKWSQDTREGEIGIEGKQAEIEYKLSQAEKTRREGAGEAPGAAVAGGYRVKNQQVWAALPESVKADFAKSQGRLPGLISEMTQLRKLVQQHGTETLPTEAKRQMEELQASITSGIKEVDQLGALDRGVSELVNKRLGDVTAWNFGFGNSIENADVKLTQAIKDLQNGAASRAAAYGLESALAPAEGDGGQRPPQRQVVSSPPAAGAPVEMVNMETGEKRTVAPHLVKAYEANGFMPTAVPGDKQASR